MKISKIAAPGTIAMAAVLGVVIGGCSSKPTPPTGDLGAQSAAGQSAAMVERQNHDPMLRKQGGFGSAQESGQAAAMQARQAAQQGHP